MRLTRVSQDRHQHKEQANQNRIDIQVSAKTTGNAEEHPVAS
jgi:hypothetical protein